MLAVSGVMLLGTLFFAIAIRKRGGLPLPLVGWLATIASGWGFWLVEVGDAWSVFGLAIQIASAGVLVAFFRSVNEHQRGDA